MVHYITCDLFDAPAEFYCHQVNCQGVMGAGLARTIRVKYPQVFEKYKIYCINHSYSSRMLGAVQAVQITDNKYVVNIFGQYRFGTERRHTDYEAIRRACTVLNARCKGHSFAIPYKMGCGLGGGDWTVIEHIINDSFSDCTVYICKRA